MLILHESNPMQLIEKLSEQEWQGVRSYCLALLPYANTEQARCARGRKNLWLQAEPIYTIKKYKPALQGSDLWEYCKLLFPEAGLAQIYYAHGWHGIDWHRDAAFAAPKARILNLGRVKLEWKPSDRGPVTTLDLYGGELIQFNSKLPHRSIPLEEERVGIGMWIDKIPLSNPTNWA